MKLNAEKEGYILSRKNNEEYLKIIDIEKVPDIDYFYKATISEDHFSQDLKSLITEFWECIDLFSILLADDIEEEIKSYDLRLKDDNSKIFNVEIKENKITFFTKYPTSEGFLDDFNE